MVPKDNIAAAMLLPKAAIAPGQRKGLLARRVLCSDDLLR
jgi:hypothetical protein